MAASKATLVSALIRVANMQGNPSAWLLGIIQGNFTSATQGDGTVLISTSSGGTSGSFALPAGMDPFSVVELAELALRTITSGIDTPVDYGANGVAQCIPTFPQLPGSQRTTSYGQFGNLRH